MPTTVPMLLPLLVALLLATTVLLPPAWGSQTTPAHCHDLVCASVVSKCMLTQACKCEISRQDGECSCCQNCTQCLGDDYYRCCSCVFLCEPSNTLSLSRESQVGDIAEPFNTLFEAFTSAPDQSNQWTLYTFPIDATLEELGRKAKIGKINYEVVSPEGTPPANTRVQVNCTVMYLSQCLSVTKCSDYCSQHGAASYRYFFDGCCECVGLTCLNYGINESRCSQCSSLDEGGVEDNHLDNALDDDEEP